MQSSIESVDTIGSDGHNGHKGVKLSLVAQFDDMCRFGNSLIDVNDNPLIEMITKCENMRNLWLSSHQELTESKSRCKQLEEENKELNSRLTHVRFGFGKEVQKKEELKEQLRQLKKQLNDIKEFVLKDPTNSQNAETRDNVLSYLNLNQLETVIEDTNESNDGLLYDVTEENILNNSEIRPKRLSKRKSTECDVNLERVKYPNRGQPSGNGGERMAPKAEFDDNIDLDSPTGDRNGFFSGDMPRTALNLNAISNEDRFGPISKSSPHMNNRGISSALFTQTNPRNLSPIFPTTPLEERKHNLHQKKAFKPVNCGPCRQAIGFFGTFLCCEECRVVCHIHCKSRLTLPCVPFRKPNGKSSQMVLIADFAPQSGRPMIPALMIHICKEIENRGLREEGIYRKCGSDKDIRELKDRILKSKTGMPSLITYDIHVLCGVVKQFLRELDEPIVTRILWRDFVRASDQENPDEEKALIMQTVEELPTANRDSLAFLMIHLICVTQSEDNQMDSRSLAKIFGPTIVGHSMIDPPMTEILAENPKQIKVMEALFRIPEDYWNGILTSTNCWETNRFGSPDRRTPSRHMLSSIQRGTLTPLRSAGRSKDTLSLRPLF